MDGNSALNIAECPPISLVGVRSDPDVTKSKVPKADRGAALRVPLSASFRQGRERAQDRLTVMEVRLFSSSVVPCSLESLVPRAGRGFKRRRMRLEFIGGLDKFGYRKTVLSIAP